ncbi:MAG: adenylate/guanylate cyclase domain-containing protein [Myxococcales bacterium]|nr:adenylate/guanylate cyclase domain-containing protein [Myxococcales bacterium]
MAELAVQGALTLDRFLERYPWSDADLQRGRPVEWYWEFEVEAPLDGLWAMLVDTSRFNRAMGLARMQFEERDGVLYGSAINGGFRQEWVEVPWTWVNGREVIAERRYTRGFAHVVRAIYRVEELAGGRLRLNVYFGWIPRGWFGRLMLWLGEGVLRRGYERVLQEMARDARESTHLAFTPPAPTLAREAEARLARARAELCARGLDEAIVVRLLDHLARADELELYRIQLRRLAREWEVDEHELLRVSLHATRVGVLDMTWDLVCPHCRGVRSELESASKLPEGDYCEVCEIDFGVGDENSIEITFHVNSAIREIPKIEFCSAEPAKKTHIKLQLELAPGETRVVAPRLPPARYRMRLRSEKAARELVVSEDAGGRALAWRSSDGDALRRCGPDPELTLINEADEPRTFVVEDLRWPDFALRPADLFVNREFHDLFSEEYVSDGVQLAVGRQTIVFTDMVGSTRFYTQRGDPEAFVEVRRHFDAIEEIIAQERGVLVKTIGDATMVVFTQPLAAVRACGAIQRHFHRDREDTPIRVRISLHVGTCIAVKLNSNIDFFGSSVNLASKLQACAEAGQVAMSRAVYESPGVVEYLEGEALEEFVFSVKALPETIDVTRWDVWTDDGAGSELSAVLMRPKL